MDGQEIGVKGKKVFSFCLERISGQKVVGNTNSAIPTRFCTYPRVGPMLGFLTNDQNWSLISNYFFSGPTKIQLNRININV